MNVSYVVSGSEDEQRISKELWTVKDVANYLDFHPNTVYKLLENGELPVIRIGGRIRFKREDIEDWISRHSFKPDILSIAVPNFCAIQNVYDKISHKGGFSEMAKAKTKSRFKLGYGAIYKRKTKDGNARWYLDYRDGSGHRIQRLVPSAITAEDAKLALDREIRMAFDQEYGIAREKAKIPFADFTQIYIENYAKVKKRSWQRSDASYLRAHLLPVFGKTLLSEINKLQIERYIAMRQSSKLERRPKEFVKKTTINREVACLRKILNKAVDWGYLIKSPMNGVKLFSERDNLKERILTYEEEERLLAVSPNHLRPILIFALHTGMRRGEIFQLKWLQVDLKAGMIKVEMTKSERTRFINANGIVLEELRKLKKGAPADGYVFVNKKTGKPLTDISTAFKTACKRSGIRNLRFHDLRHTFASRLVANGVDLITVKELLGHSTVKTTERCQRSSNNHPFRSLKNHPSSHVSFVRPQALG